MTLPLSASMCFQRLTGKGIWESIDPPPGFSSELKIKIQHIIEDICPHHEEKLVVKVSFTFHMRLKV